MDRVDLLQIAKPILFNTDMVRAILDGRKTVTRRLVKQGKRSTPEYHGRDKFYGIADHLNNDYKHRYAGFYNDNDVFYVDGKEHIDAIYFKAQYKLGDILYVRETWQCWRAKRYEATADIMFRAGGDGIQLQFANGNTDSVNRDDFDTFADKWFHADGKWNPSIHMPKEAARIFLKVRDVRVERLQDAETEDDRNYIAEGAEDKHDFIRIWNSTVKPDSGLDWYSNPWVWVIEFERIEVE